MSSRPTSQPVSSSAQHTTVSPDHHSGQITFKCGHDDDRPVAPRHGESIAQALQHLLAALAAEHGCSADEFIVIREGHHEPVSTLIIVDEHYPGRHRHHVHHASTVKVTVYYQAGQIEREFKRYETIDDIRFWAIQAFAIDPDMATEIELARHGQTEKLATTEHIGHLAGRCPEIKLDLVRDPIANG